MKNYRNSDYALNRYREGIVYRFSDQTVEVTLEEYLHDNPDKTAEDFQKIKELSDAIYLEQDRTDSAQTKKNTSLKGVEKISDELSIEEIFIEGEDRETARRALASLLNENTLSETQKRRLMAYIVKGVSLRQIASMEGTSHIAVRKSIQSAIKKIRKHFIQES